MTVRVLDGSIYLTDQKNTQKCPNTLIWVVSLLQPLPTAGYVCKAKTSLKRNSNNNLDLSMWWANSYQKNSNTCRVGQVDETFILLFFAYICVFFISVAFVCSTLTLRRTALFWNASCQMATTSTSQANMEPLWIWVVQKASWTVTTGMLHLSSCPWSTHFLRNLPTNFQGSSVFLLTLNRTISWA